MAARCTIPCSVGGVESRIRTRALQTTLAPNIPVIGAGVLLLLVSPVLIAFAGWQVALIAALFFALGVGVVVVRGFLRTAEYTRIGVPEELGRIVEAHASEIHAARLPALRATAAGLRYDTSEYRARVTAFLHELREATGEAWRCPCKKRRFPLPLPF